MRALPPQSWSLLGSGEVSTPCSDRVMLHIYQIVASQPSCVKSVKRQSITLKTSFVSRVMGVSFHGCLWASVTSHHLPHSLHTVRCHDGASRLVFCSRGNRWIMCIGSWSQTWPSVIIYPGATMLHFRDQTFIPQTSLRRNIICHLHSRQYFIYPLE